MKKLKILALDSEGGHGGSSRSLFTTLKNLNKQSLELCVICKKESWIKSAYQKQGIKCLIFKNIPTFTCVPKISRNIYNLFKFIIFLWPKSYYFRLELKKISKNFSIIHFNHINQFLIAIWLKKNNPKIKISMHIRTTPKESIFSKLQYKIVYKNFKNLVFITENEYHHFKKLSGAHKLKKNIIFNSVESNSYRKNKYAYIKNKNKLILGSISNYSYFRGTDRIMQILSILPKNILSEIHVVIAGDIKISRTTKKILNLSKDVTCLESYAKSLGLQNNFTFLGHINDPDNLIIHLNLIIKLTRENNPWGRDIIESMYYGIPVLSIGTYDFFIKNNISGILLSHYDKNIISNIISKFTKNPTLLEEMGIEAKKVIYTHCNAKKNSKTIKAFWKKCKNF